VARPERASRLVTFGHGGVTGRVVVRRLMAGLAMISCSGTFWSPGRVAAD